MLLGLDVQHHAAHVRLVHRAYYLGHNGKARATRKSQHFVFLDRHEFLHHRNAGRTQQGLHLIGRDVTVLLNGVDDTPDARYVHTEQLNLVIGRPRGIEHPAQGCTQGYLVGKVHVAFGQEVGHFCSCRIDRRQDGKYRLAAMLHLLVQDVVHLVHGHQPRRAKDGQHGIDVIQLLFAIIQTKSQMFGCTRSQDVDGIAHSGPWIKFRLQFVHQRAFQFGDVQPAFTQGVGQHHTGTSGMGDDSKVAPLQFRQGEDAAHGGQFLTGKATHDARLTE